MVTKRHEASLELFQRYSNLLPALVSAHGWELPAEISVDCESARFTEQGPYELNADYFGVIRTADKPILSVIYEVQLETDTAKRRSWPRYLAGAWARHKCPVALLVYCPKPPVARWAAKPIVMGRNCTVTPTVISIDSLPVITDPADWDGDIAQAVVSAFFHSSGPDGELVLTALSELLSKIEITEAQKYAGCLIETLPAAASLMLEVIMTAGTYQYQDAFALIEKRSGLRGEKRGEKLGFTKGALFGEAKALLSILEARGIQVPEAARGRIMACDDETQLDAWLARALHVSNIDELLD